MTQEAWEIDTEITETLVITLISVSYSEFTSSL